MKLIKRDGRFVAVCTYDEKDIPKQAGFRWDPEVRQWWTQFPEQASRLVGYADESCKQELQSMAQAKEEALTASRATSADIEVPVPENLKYFSYQLAGIDFMQRTPSRRGVLLGDEMGLGKTIQVIGYLNLHPEFKNILIICPVTLRGNWKREIERWSVVDRKVGIADSNFIPDADTIIIGYEALVKQSSLQQRDWDVLVADECSRVKNSKAQRSMAVYAITAKRKIFLTGTPIMNRPIELWPIVRYLDPEFWTYTNKQGELKEKFFTFAKTFCDAHQSRYGWDFSGASNLNRLQEILRSRIMIRRLKKEVLTELPAKIRQVIEIPPNGAMAVVQNEIKVWEQYELKIVDLKAKVEIAKAESEEDYKVAVGALRDAITVAFSEMARLRHETALAKVPAALDFLDDIVESGNKVVVFGWHHDVIRQVKDHFGNQAVELTGETPQKDRDGIVNRFQTDPECKVFVGSITAAGLGLTLTAASHVVFLELDWTPSNVTQAEDRCHRIGQSNSVLVQYLVFDDSLDARMAKVLVAKQEVINQALDHHDEPEIEVVVPSKASQSGTENAKRKQIVEEASKLTPEDIDKIHRQIRFLALKCDGAVTWDGVGFNKIDTRIGHEFAARSQLTPKQAALARRILVKYSKQLERTGL